MTKADFGDAAAELASAASLLLNWRPDEFWNSTPAELTLALTSPSEAGEPVTRDSLEALKRQFPDR